MEEANNVERVGLSLWPIDTTTATTIWKARHERSNSYMFIKPSLKQIAKDLADEMIRYMPPQAKP